MDYKVATPAYIDSLARKAIDSIERLETFAVVLDRDDRAVQEATLALERVLAVVQRATVRKDEASRARLRLP